MGKGKKALNITEGLVKNATKPKSYVNLGKEEGSGVVDALRGTLDAAAPQPDWSVYDTSENIVGEGLGLEGLFGGKKVYLDQDPQKVKRANEAIKEFNSFLTESKVNSEDLVAETGDYFNSTRKQALDNDLGMVYRTDDVPSYNTFDPNDYNLSTDNSFISTPDFLGYDDLQKVIRDIKNVGGNIAGVVYNKIPVSAKKYNETYYYASKTPTPKSRSEIEQEQKREALRARAAEMMNKKTEITREETELPKAMRKEKIEPEREKTPEEKTAEVLREFNEYLKKEKRTNNNRR